jgi:hypothetical protein
MATKVQAWLGPAALVLVSGCGALLNIDPASSGGFCKVEDECPETYACVEGWCRPADGGRLTSDAAVADAGMGDAEMGDAGMGDAEMGDVCASPDAASCANCSDPITETCACGVCRNLSWASPESEFARPQPAMLGDRIYAGLTQGIIYAQRIVVPPTGAGLLVRLGMLVSTNQAPTQFGVALYHDGGGYPVDPFVTPPLQTFTVNAEGRVEVPVDPPVHIDPGSYWIAFVATQKDFVFQRIDNLIATAEGVALTGGSPWPGPFPATSAPPTTMQAQEILIYAAIAIDP